MLLPPAPEITAASILAESRVMNLARPQGFRLRQASSYDRRSVRPGTSDWYANDDWGKYVREETNDGRREWVMADLKGPGALVHQWSANPVGNWRYYFDGETTPRLTTTGKEISAGRWLGFGEPFAYVASRGANLYFPLTYARSLKVTVDASDGDPGRMYYLLGHRDYPAGTTVKTFASGDETGLSGARVLVEDDLDSNPRRGATRGNDQTLRPGESMEFWAPNVAGELTLLKVSAGLPRSTGSKVLDPADPQSLRIYRGLVLEGEFDGEPCISAPVDSFFGGLPRGPVSATAVGGYFHVQFRSTLPMPFTRRARLRIRNLNDRPVHVIASASGREIRSATDATLDKPVYLLHAQFRRHPGPSRPFRDMPVAHLKGRGHYVGTVLHVANPSLAWWGEGDEKVRVDGEAFPSIFGTGTEDYFGYAWSSNEPFSRPYHAQPRAEPRGNSGHIANVRWHVLDPIPYTKSLDFDLEQWHWRSVASSFATTGFWYAAPGGTRATPLTRSDVAVSEVVLPQPEPGAFQGEALEIVERVGGTTENQSGFEELVDAQLWWRDAAPGTDKLVLRLPEVPAGRYRVEIRAAYAKDYGRMALDLDGRDLGTKDFYSPELVWRRLNLGTVDLRGGRPTLTVRALRPNAKAEPRNMFGLDWIKLVRVR